MIEPPRIIMTFSKTRRDDKSTDELVLIADITVKYTVRDEVSNIMKRKWFWVILLLVVLSLGLFLHREHKIYHRINTKIELQKRLDTEAKDFCATVAGAFVNGDPDKITEYLYKDDSTTIDHIEAYSDLQIIYDDMVFINGKVSDVDGDFCTCVIRYRLLSDIPDELKDTIVVFPNQDADYIYQTIGYSYDTTSDSWGYVLLSYELYAF